MGQDNCTLFVAIMNNNQSEINSIRAIYTFKETDSHICLIQNLNDDDFLYITNYGYENEDQNHNNSFDGENVFFKGESL